MKVLRFVVLAGLALAVSNEGARAEENAWPIYVMRTDPSNGEVHRSWAGPLLFSRTEAGGKVAGFRPFFVRRTDPKGDTIETTVLYPLFYYRTYGVVYEWSVFKLINRVGRRENVPEAEKDSTTASEKNFSVWPIYFSRRSPDKSESYTGVFPLYGELRNFLGYTELKWALFPLYLRTVKRGTTTTHAPWPIVRAMHGNEEGFAIWPLFGHSETSDGGTKQYVLWPIYWNNVKPAGPDAPAGTEPTHDLGIFPFYTKVEGPGIHDETYLWPFFGTTDRERPEQYHETRYFWPFFVQGRGDTRTVNRWGPFYTHSVKKGVDSTWVGWPLWHRKSWDDGQIAETQTKFFYFVVSSDVQRRSGQPEVPPASKTHLWPFFSAWDNGAGRRQLQILSPFEPLFANNPEMRDAWSPLTAVIRHEETSAGDSRTSLLWNAITWTRSDGRLSELHLGPLFGLRRAQTNGPWHAVWFDFASRN